jgi:hypothetical protein
MKIIVAAIALVALAGCSSDREQIIKDVCVPINKEGGPKLEDLARAKGYDVEHTKDVCRQYLRDQVQGLSNTVRDSGLGKKSDQ